jgi:glycosyltransferase involved in cell wall biosynthesis
MPEIRPKQLKVLAVMERGLENPSAMVAGLQYRELFEQHGGYRVAFESLIPSHPFAVGRVMHYGRMLRLGAVMDGLDRRHQQYQEDRLVEYARDCDVVYAIKIPSLNFYRRIKALGKPKILTCLADGLWLPYFQRCGWQDLGEILRLSDGVSCESEYMAGYARSYNSRIFIVPDSPQVHTFDAWRSRVARDEGRITLGWVGTPSTSMSLYKIWEPLEELFRRHPELHLRIVGSDHDHLPRFEKVVWSAIPRYDQQLMVQEVLKMDIGLFPLFQVEEALARGSLKPMIYMSGEVAAVCQDFGDSQDLIQDGVNGMLAGSSSQWLEKLEYLIAHAEERRRLAANGLETIRSRFSREICFARLTRAIEAIA